MRGRMELRSFKRRLDRSKRTRVAGVVRRRLGVSCSSTGDFVEPRQSRTDRKGVNMGLGLLRVRSSSPRPLEDEWLQSAGTEIWTGVGEVKVDCDMDGLMVRVRVKLNAIETAGRILRAYELAEQYRDEIQRIELLRPYVDCQETRKYHGESLILADAADEECLSNTQRSFTHVAVALSKLSL